MVFQLAFFNRNRRQKPNQEFTDHHELMVVQSARQGHEKDAPEKVHHFKPPSLGGPKKNPTTNLEKKTIFFLKDVQPQICQPLTFFCGWERWVPMFEFELFQGRLV